MKVDSIDCREASRLYFVNAADGAGEWVYDPGETLGRHGAHDPMDRVGGPYKLHDLVEGDNGGEKWFLFAVADCAFPIYDLVRSDDEEDAYDAYCEWASENRHIAITPEQVGDYTEENGDQRGYFTSGGTWVDDDNVRCHELKLVRIEFGPPKAGT